jgi:hypothetical protein
MRDRLPEHTDYRDDGCDLYARCLTCELPACRYDLAPNQGRALKLAAELATLVALGATVEQAAHALGRTPRSIYRLKVLVPAEASA